MQDQSSLIEKRFSPKQRSKVFQYAKSFGLIFLALGICVAPAFATSASITFVAGISTLAGTGSPGRQPENQQKWIELAKRAQADEQLKQQLLNDPTPLVLKTGMEIPVGATVRVVQESGHLKCIFEAPKAAAAAAGAEISDSDLHRVVGGTKQLAPVLYEVEDYSFDIERK